MTQIPPKLLEQIEKVYLHPESWDTALGLRVRSIFTHLIIEKVEKLPNELGEMSARAFDQSKKELFVTPFRGQFFKKCPGNSQRKAITCCNYHVLNLGSQCNMNCSYCYLQSYLNTPTLTLYSNLSDALSELTEMGVNNSAQSLRIGTGEVMDSLSLDPLTLFSRELIGFFKNYPQWILEFKTKSSLVDQFLDCSHAGNVVVSWSVNPQEVIEHEEHGTASLQERLDAARKCLDHGFPVAFHLDPLIYHPNWQENYSRLVHEITSRFKPSEVQGITMGTLRFQQEQRHIMRERFGMKSWVTKHQMFASESGKLRYDFHLRNQMFEHVLAEFRKKDSWTISLCMETPESWVSSYDKMPSQMPELRPFYRPMGLT